jgi:hypothetical protein
MNIRKLTLIICGFLLCGIAKAEIPSDTTLTICQQELPYHYPLAQGDTVFDKGTTSGDYVIRRPITTDCESIVTLHLTVNPAPDSTLIIRKGTSNILICADANTAAHYFWGYTHLETEKDTIYYSEKGTIKYADYLKRETTLIPNEYADYQYFEMTHDINTSEYQYFVDIYHGNDGCSTRSYFNQRIYTGTQQPAANTQQVTVFPNPAKEHFSLSLGTAFTGKVLVSLKNLSGATLLTKQIADYKNNEVVQFNLNLPTGIYLLVVQTNEAVLTSKVVIK